MYPLAGYLNHGKCNLFVISVASSLTLWFILEEFDALKEILKEFESVVLSMGTTLTAMFKKIEGKSFHTLPV